MATTNSSRSITHDKASKMTCVCVVLLYVGEAVLNAIDLLDNALGAPQQALVTNIRTESEQHRPAGVNGTGGGIVGWVSQKMGRGGGGVSLTGLCGRPLPWLRMAR